MPINAIEYCLREGALKAENLDYVVFYEKPFLKFDRLLERFRQKTHCPLVINTSFNIRGEPIVCSPENAFHCFRSTNMDVLVLEDFILYKDEQPQMKQIEIDEYLAKFELD